MFLYILLLVLGLPLIEIALFVALGDALGVVGTLLEVIVTACLGLFLLTQYSLLSLSRNPQALMQAMMQGQSAMANLLNSALLALAGVFLLLPGFFTDSLGVLLLLPPLRSLLVERLWHLAITRMRQTSPDDIVSRMTKMGGRAPRGRPVNPKGPNVIDGEYSSDD